MTDTETWKGEIKSVLQELGGEAHLNDIYERIEENDYRDLDELDDWRAIVRRTIYNHSSEADAFAGGEDLFSPVDEKGDGYWKLRNGDLESGFTWVPFFEKLAERLLTFRDRQDELIELQKGINEEVGKDPKTSLKDKPQENQSGILREIDPFTFIGLITRFGEEKIKIASEYLKKELNIDSEPIETIHGLPRTNPTNCRYTRWEYRRGPNDIDMLWDFSEEIVNKPSEQVDPELFSQTLDIEMVGVSKLTQGMFWHQPNKHFPVDSQTEPYLRTKDIAVSQLDEMNREPNYETYLSIIGTVHDQFDQGYPRVSYYAWQFDEGDENGNDSPTSVNEIDYWVFQANPDRWDLPEGLRQGTVDKWAVSQHQDDISPGDKVILWQTGDEAGCYAMAEVTSEVLPAEDTGFSETKVKLDVEENYVDNPITQDEIEDHPELTSLNVGVQGTNFSASQREYKALKSLRKNNRESDSPSFWKLSPGSGAKFWDQWKDQDIISIGWDELGDIRGLSRSEYEDLKDRLADKYPDRGFEATAPDQVWKFLHDMEVGDRVVANRGTGEVLGIGEITSGYYVEPEADNHIHRRKVEWTDLETREVDEGGWRRTLVQLDEQKFEKILDMGAKDWSEKIDRPSLSNDFEIDTDEVDLYFPNDMRERLETQIQGAFLNNKNIILVGPPGTGKSKLAKYICDRYLDDSGNYLFSTATSDWTTFDTIGGLRPNQSEQAESLAFEPGLFLDCFREDTDPVNKWLIIDEINRADIDKAFGALFSVLAGDSITLSFNHESGKPITVKPQTQSTQETYSSISPHEYVMPDDWRLVATMNTYDKTSLYEMSYAFMRRFAFVPVGIPDESDITVDMIDGYLNVWGTDVSDQRKSELKDVWTAINNHRSIGPAIVKDLVEYVESSGGDWVSALVMYVLPQFEGLIPDKQTKFIKDLKSFNGITEGDWERLAAEASQFFGLNEAKFSGDEGN